MPFTEAGITGDGMRMSLIEAGEGATEVVITGEEATGEEATGEEATGEEATAAGDTLSLVGLKEANAQRGWRCPRFSVEGL